MASAYGSIAPRRLPTALLLAGAVAALALILGALASPAARADSPIYNFEVSTSTTQAGGHPDIHTVVWMGNRDTQHIPAPSCDCQDPKDIQVEMPTGIIGNPNAVPRCSATDFANLVCPPEAQVGTVIPGIEGTRPNDGSNILGTAAVYNLLPHPGQAGLLGFNVPFLKAPIFLVINARTESDYGLEVSTTDITHPLPLSYVDLILWGVPASPTNDVNRQPPGWDPSYQGINPPTPSNAPLRAFLNNPTTCDSQSLSASVEVTSYDKGITHATTPFPPTTGCDQLSFNPSLYAQPTTTETDTASGLDVDLQVPQPASPSVPSPSQIRATTVTLPRGFSINPNAADGKVACSDADSRIGTREESACPETSKVGTVSVDSSALPGPIPGFIYLGEPKPGNPYRLILTADGYNVHVKLAGTAEADPEDGRITVSFQDLPQTPFSDFNLHFFGSERGLLATSPQCGTYPVTSTFTPWDAALSEQTSTQFFTLESGPGGSPCPDAAGRPFGPSAHAGVADKTAGQHAPFSLVLERPDGDQALSSLAASTPPGFLATLAGIPYCPDATLTAIAAPGSSGRAEQAAPSCPAASQIGDATAGAGAGAHPVYLGGRIYLAGPYKGAPLSLAVVTPAVSGPYDLGNVVVRAALHIDPTTAQITATSDPLPQILEGIPLRLRYILINLDRPKFTLNPTNCDPFAVGTELFGDQGGKASLSTQFQIANCRNLDFGPKLNLRLTGGLNRLGHPAIHATLTAKPGESNISSVSTALPKGELLDNNHLGTPCTRPQFVSNSCPASSLLGTAEAVTPLLEKPLKGNVYLRTSNHKLPDLVADLEGQIDIELAGKIDTIKGGALRTTFETVPDAPVTSFKLDLLGGAKGLLQNSKSLCGKAKRAEVSMTGQNGAVVDSKPKLEVACGKARHRRAARRGAQR